MMHPITTDVTEVTSTAADDKSLINLMAGFFCGQTTSHNFSIAVLKSSAIQTSPMAIAIKSNSVDESLIKQHITITTMVAIA